MALVRVIFTCIGVLRVQSIGIDINKAITSIPKFISAIPKTMVLEIVARGEKWENEGSEREREREREGVERGRDMVTRGEREREGEKRTERDGETVREREK